MRLTAVGKRHGGGATRWKREPDTDNKKMPANRMRVPDYKKMPATRLLQPKLKAPQKPKAPQKARGTVGSLVAKPTQPPWGSLIQDVRRDQRPPPKASPQKQVIKQAIRPVIKQEMKLKAVPKMVLKPKAAASPPGPRMPPPKAAAPPSPVPDEEQEEPWNEEISAPDELGMNRWSSDEQQESSEDGSSEELDRMQRLQADEPETSMEKVCLSLASHIMFLSQSLKLLICFQSVESCILSLVFECL